MKNWKPTATLNFLRQRATIISGIRDFFEKRGVLEVETSLLGPSTATDPFITSFRLEGREEASLYLQTSPEFYMKRLLASGSGSIYQISKAFRSEEVGRLHNAEFTLLEWYRVGFNHHQLMDEMDALLGAVLRVAPASRMTYAQVFHKYLGIDPHTIDLVDLEMCARENMISFENKDKITDKDFWLHLLMTHSIEPKLIDDKPIFITDFPISQAALAKIRPGRVSVAERFEVYYKGIELANGYHELTDAKEQQQRFLKDNQKRLELGLSQIPIDAQLIAALHHGMPDCAGVALGVDRLVMLAAGAKSIEEVVSFV